MKHRFVTGLILLSLIFNISVLNAEEKSKDTLVSQESLNSKLSSIKTIPNSLLASMSTEELVNNLVQDGKMIINIGLIPSPIVNAGKPGYSKYAIAAKQKIDFDSVLVDYYDNLSEKEKKFPLAPMIIQSWIAGMDDLQDIKKELRFKILEITLFKSCESLSLFGIKELLLYKLISIENPKFISNNNLNLDIFEKNYKVSKYINKKNIFIIEAKRLLKTYKKGEK